MGRITFIILLLYSVSGFCSVKPDTLDYIIITVCNVPSIIIFKDKKIIRAMPISVFFGLKQYEKMSTKITNTPKEKINHLDAALWTIKPHACGITI